MADSMHFSFETYHPKQVLREMNNLRSEGSFCDVTICADGREFMCHRLLLASSSSYFKIMFSTDMMESRQNMVAMNGIEPDVMALIIEYIYTSELLITTDNIQSLLSAAHLLDMITIKDACCTFMEKNMDPSNCIGIECLTETLCLKDLQKKAKQFTLQHFPRVCRKDELLSVPPSKLIELISDDSLNVGTEELVLISVMRWYHHDKDSRRDHFPDIFEHVRLPLLTPDILHGHVQSEDVIKQSDKCMNLVNSARKKHPPKSTWFDRLCTYGNPRNPSDDSPSAVPLWTVGQGITDLDYLPSGDILVAGVSGLHVFDKRGCKVDHSLSGMGKCILEGICVDKSLGRVGVIQLLGDKPGCLNIYFKAARKWKQEIYYICQQPRCVASSGDGGFIVGTYCNTLHRYDGNYNEVWCRQMSGNVHDVAVDSAHNIMVCHDDYITVHNPLGKQMFAFPPSVTPAKQTIIPRGICADSKNNILVADHTSQSILLYSNKGKYLGQLLKVEGKPWSMALYKDKYLCVSVNDDVLFMYTLS